MLEERPGATPAAAQHVVGGEAAAHRELGVDVLEVLQVPALVRVREDEVEGPRQLLDELVRVGKPGVDEEATPASSRLRSASAWREGSISIVVSVPPVLLRPHAIQIDECPVEVPISSARVWRPLTTRSWRICPSTQGTFMSRHVPRFLSR